jgi:hypothetical protein
LLAVASSSVHVAASPTTAGAGFGLQPFPSTIAGHGSRRPPVFVVTLTAVNRHFEPFGFVIVLHLLSKISRHLFFISSFILSHRRINH